MTCKLTLFRVMLHFVMFSFPRSAWEPVSPPLRGRGAGFARRLIKLRDVRQLRGAVCFLHPRFVDQEAAHCEEVHLRGHEAPERILRGTNDRLSADIERGID